ncbi:hypothetical protein M0R88_04445 [Halorussus gelatinilyticus]|uniref:Ig-like domain-containing protein n=1 Tax=Halorussus gelatinilyticus TaxID=2937524 RepID=A0A8U0IJQ2_9EURY|nr:hypothetical protein [Halorussus gelatinilyticus]UPW01357.1 hypothetical protein M0R88_04445 [Halorussus gelatinilyticus]
MASRWILAVVVCVLLAGCGGPSTDGGTGETTQTTSAERVLAPPPGTTTAPETGSTTGAATGGTGATAANAATTNASTSNATNGTAQTTMATYDKNVGYELRVSNAGPTERTVTVRVVDANDSTVTVEVSVDLAANESVERDLDFPSAGTYEVSVEVGDASATEEWAVASRDPEDALSVHVSEDGEVYLGFVAI